MENNQNEPIVTPGFTGNEKLFSVLAYIVILWLVGLLVSPEKNSSFVKKHVNNGILLTIASVIEVVIYKFPVVGPIIGALIGLVTSILAIIGIVKAVSGEDFVMPIIEDKVNLVK